MIHRFGRGLGRCCWTMRTPLGLRAADRDRQPDPHRDGPVLKPAEYAAAGVPSYWRAETEP